MATTKPVVTHENGVWVIRLEDENGKRQEYRCAAERQARQLAALLSAGDKSAKAVGAG